MLLFQATAFGSKTSGVKLTQQKSTNPSISASNTVSRGSVQNLPDLDDDKTKGSQKRGPVEDFPVNLDLTSNPQGDTLDISFLFIGPGEEKLLVLPFPNKEKRSANCPGTAQEANPSILPP